MSDQPLPRVAVTATAGAPPARSVRTDLDGTFTLALASATEVVRINAAKAGFVSTVVDLRVRSGVVTDARIAMARGGSISGRAGEESGGVPISAAAVGIGVTVSEIIPVLHRVAADGTMTPASPATVTRPSMTDPEGRYRFGGLPAGRYALGVELRPPNQAAALPSPTFVDIAAGQQVDGVDLFVRAMQPSTQTAALPEGDASIRGRVTVLGGEPLAGATVIALQGREAMLGRATGTTRTDALGRFALDGLPPGTFSVRAAKLGYVSWPARRDGAASVTVPLAAGERREDLELSLARTGIISGTVVDEFGDPLQNAMVRVSSVNDNNLPPSRDPMFSSATDDRGQFRIAGLEPRAYFISASGPDASTDAAEVYAPIYYPGTRERLSALPITISPAAHVSTIVVTLRPVPVGTISGRALDSAGSPATGALRLLARDAVFVERSVTVGPAGAFTFAGVPSGAYLMEMTTTGPSGREFGTQPVRVTGVEQPAMVLRTRPGATITGRLLLEGSSGGAIQGYTMTARRVTGVSTGTGGSRTVSGPITHGTRFTMTELWGPTRVQVTSPDERWYLKSITINGFEVADSPFDFGLEGRSFEDVEAVFAAGPAAITGRVLDDRRVPAVAASVLAFASESSRWFLGSRWIKSATTNVDGAFAIKGLPPGEYYVVAVEGLDRAARQDPSSFLDELLPSATRVPAAGGVDQVTTLRAPRR
jgi:protocatechuate 3,4-dioxygenase beta subunit